MTAKLPQVSGSERVNSSSALAIPESSALLVGLDRAAMRAMLAAARVRRIPAKQAIITGGQLASHLFLVQSGRVRYYHLTKHGESVLLAQLLTGDVIGLVALLKAPSTYMATAEATSDCELLVWERSVIRSFVSLYPVLGENGLRIALGHLRNYVKRHVGLVTKTAEEKLAETLLKLGQQSGDVHPDGIEILATNDELGALADISRFTASRLLSDWVRAGTLSKGRGRILLHAPEALMID